MIQACVLGIGAVVVALVYCGYLPEKQAAAFLFGIPVGLLLAVLQDVVVFKERR